MTELTVDSLSKQFGERVLFHSLSFRLATGAAVVVTGQNGSGKSTLVQIAASLISPTAGTIALHEDGKPVPSEQTKRMIGIIAPYWQFYSELTAEENLKFFLAVSGVTPTGSAMSAALATVGLGGRGMDRVRTYSSGMVQRLRYAHMILKNPEIILLDEPTCNLDAEGKRIAFSLIQSWSATQALLIATNETEELTLGRSVITLGG